MTVLFVTLVAVAPVSLWLYDVLQAWQLKFSLGNQHWSDFIELDV